VKHRIVLWRSGRYEWSYIGRLSPYEGIQRGLLIFEGNDVEHAVLPMREENEVTRLDRRGDVRNADVIIIEAV
jgi:hypothetical protein